MAHTVSNAIARKETDAEESSKRNTTTTDNEWIFRRTIQGYGNLGRGVRENNARQRLPGLFARGCRKRPDRKLEIKMQWTYEQYRAAGWRADEENMEVLDKKLQFERPVGLQRPDHALQPSWESKIEQINE